ncbi:hypothetical protein PSTG_04547 [Puccinia striiformis f. sp. tritici PST-78]|uniref:MULE transposase domain-containing protein n=1 Tax=Puccinia striiformis f. sp. tritici PST-78 TaxID=1165861 RepID=A0A0L0VST2_9BASI|nr:hypothetical protein PSTG_04547 [Puccinia striiformis f. sp. tritici PST-78]
MLCAWHIQKNLLAKASKLTNNPEQEKDMLNYWSNIVKIQVQADFLSYFSRFSTKYGTEFKKYVTKIGLPVAEHYSNAWTNNIAHLNNRTTSRMESAHTFIKSHLLGPQHGFTSVIKLISNALESQYHEIASKFHQQKRTSLRYLGSIFRECKGIISNYALRKAYTNLVEAKKTKKEGQKLSPCNQHYGARMWIPCNHRMAEIIASGEPISPDEFHEQWHLKSIRAVHRTNNKEMMAKIEEIKEKLVSMNPVQMALQLAAINRILEGMGTVIDIKLPIEDQSARGRPRGSKNKPKTTKRDQPAFEDVEKKRKNEEKQAGKVKKQKMEEDKKQAAVPKKRVLPTQKGKSGTPKTEETTEEEAISDKEESTPEEEESTSEEEKPATKKTAHTRHQLPKTTKEEKKQAPAPKKKTVSIKTTPAPITTTSTLPPKKKIAPVKTASLPSTKKITPSRTATLCPCPPITSQPPPQPLSAPEPEEDPTYNPLSTNNNPNKHHKGSQCPI